MSRRAIAVAALEDRIGHRFNDRDLIERALTHASILGLGRSDTQHNEQLEFLGDRVLGLVVAGELVSRYPDGTPSLLTRRLHTLVDRAACAAAARKMGVPEAVRVPSGGGLRNNDTALSDTCEAVIAALYLEGGLELARSVILDIWAEEFDHPLDLDSVNPKTALQVWALGTIKQLPRYRVISREGPAHAPDFVIEVQVGSLVARGEGRSRQDAEKAAAQALLQRERPAL